MSEGSAEELRVRCQLRRSVFDDEYVISIRQADGEPIEFVSDQDAVEVVREPDDGVPGEGFVRVWALRTAPDSYRILVPASGGSDSMIVNVPQQLAVL